MNWIRTEEEAEALLNEMVRKSKGKYITQGVAFNKNSESQMKLLKMALMHSYNFGGMIKEMLNERFSNPASNNSKQFEVISNNNAIHHEETRDESVSNLKQFKNIQNEQNFMNKKVGNFI